MRVAGCGVRGAGPIDCGFWTSDFGLNGIVQGAEGRGMGDGAEGKAHGAWRTAHGAGSHGMDDFSGLSFFCPLRAAAQLDLLGRS